MVDVDVDVDEHKRTRAYSKILISSNATMPLKADYITGISDRPQQQLHRRLRQQRCQ